MALQGGSGNAFFHFERVGWDRKNHSVRMICYIISVFHRYEIGERITDSIRLRKKYSIFDV